MRNFFILTPDMVVMTSSHFNSLFPFLSGIRQRQFRQGYVSKEERRQLWNSLCDEDPSQGSPSEEEPAGTHINGTHDFAEY